MTGSKDSRIALGKKCPCLVLRHPLFGVVLRGIQKQKHLFGGVPYFSDIPKWLFHTGDSSFAPSGEK